MGFQLCVFSIKQNISVLLETYLYTAATCSEKYSSLWFCSVLISVRNGFWIKVLSVAGMSRCVHNLLSEGNKHIAICASLHVQTPWPLTSLTNTAGDCKQQNSCPKIVCDLVTSRNKSCVYLQKEQTCFSHEKPMYWVCLRGNQIYADWQSDSWSIR